MKPLAERIRGLEKDLNIEPIDFNTIDWEILDYYYYLVHQLFEKPNYGSY